MPRTVQIKLYSYEELSPEAQKAARVEWVEEDRSNGSHGACDQVNEDFEQVVGDAGYPTKDIRWSLSYCQGDGMAFYGDADVGSSMLDRLQADNSVMVTELDLDAVKRLLEIEAIQITLRITRNSFGNHYSHYNTMDVQLLLDVLEDLPDGDGEKILDQVLRLEKIVEKDVRSLSRKLAADGYSMLESYYEDEYVAGILTDNDYQFTVNGEFWYHDNWVEQSNGKG